MIEILHVSAECYPAAKAGGLGDVVGALPKYLNQAKAATAVILPKYYTKWLDQQEWTEIYRGVLRLAHHYIPFAIEQLEIKEDNDLGFPLFVVNIPGKFDREGVYIDPHTGFGWKDETERAICFQQAVLYWVMAMQDKPKVIHCHDHHTGLIPFMMKHCYEFNSLHMIPTVFTIHNGEYHGAFSWERISLLPFFDINVRGLLDWGNSINPLACAIKCCWKLTTVSPGYLEELQLKSNGLEWLLNHESPKSHGILNGIDNEVWNPKTDKFIAKKLGRSVPAYKKANKAAILERFNVRPDLPIFTFIGRLVGEKGAQLLPDLISRFIHSGFEAAFVILGTGDPNLHRVFAEMKHQFQGYFDVALEYNEGLAHQLYAGSDFLLMPSKVEPCGLNQMYALRYGTVPVVRSIGGLKNSIRDISEENGTGVRFDHFTTYDAFIAVQRATELYQNQKVFAPMVKRIMKEDFSWERSAKDYLKVYGSLMS